MGVTKGSGRNADFDWWVWAGPELGTSNERPGGTDGFHLQWPGTHLGFSLSSMNSRVNNFLSRNMFITPPAPQHLGQHGALLELRLLHFNVALETQMRGQDPICEP